MPLSAQDRIFLAKCEAVKASSHDPDRQVGAVIVSGEGAVLATGSNAPPKELQLGVAQSHEFIRQDPNWKYYVLEHAERNAIRNAYAQGHVVTGATMYGTLYPCSDCARAIVAAGIKRLVVPAPHSNPERDQKWSAQYHYAEDIFEMAGTRVDFALPNDAAST